MPRLEWLVPVIVLLVYFIGWIIKTREEIDAKAKKPAGKPPGQELDRFLEEIDRLRREQANKPVAVETADIDEDDERSAPVIRPTPVLPQRPVIIRQRPRLVTVTPAPPTPLPPAPPVWKPPAAAPAFVTTPTPGPFIGGRLSAPRTSSVAIVMGLLRNPKTIASALVLNEILGPPKSKSR